MISKIACEFKLEDGFTHMMETRVEERQKVEAKYEDAVASGQTAVMGGLVKGHADMVRINIGNFPPKSEAVLTVYYYQTLEVEDLSYCLRIPTAYIPKYMGDVKRLLDGQT